MGSTVVSPGGGRGSQFWIALGGVPNSCAPLESLLGRGGSPIFGPFFWGGSQQLCPFGVSLRGVLSECGPLSVGGVPPPPLPPKSLTRKKKRNQTQNSVQKTPKKGTI